MIHIVNGKLNDNAHSFPVENGQGFSVKIGKPYKDHKSSRNQPPLAS